MPDGFPSLSELKTDNFDYNIKKGKVTVVADLEDPVKLLGQGMTIDDVKMTFKYDKNNPGGKWSFNAEGWVNSFFFFFELPWHNFRPVLSNPDSGVRENQESTGKFQLVESGLQGLGIWNPAND